MILSRCSKIYPDTDEPGNIIIFSTNKASKISLPKAMLDDISRGRLSDEERETLIELGLLVETEAVERTAMLRFMSELNREDKIFTVQLVMNLDCNLDCGYCFEGSRKGRHYLSEPTAEAFGEFIRKSVPSGIEELRITFYGGEPLLSREMIVTISNAMKALAADRGITYTGRLVTNGTLLTGDALNLLIPAGIMAASVTLDGPESIHDASRPFKGGKGSFRTIVKNLKEACSLLDLELSGNFTKTNYRRFPELFDILLKEGLTPDKISSLQFYPVLQETEEMANCGFKEGCMSVNEPWLFDAEIFLREEIMKRGYRTSKIIPAACMMELEKRIIVNYDGSIYKCSGLIGREEYKAGDIGKGIGDYHASHHLDNWKNEKCLACEYLPLCFGGCRYMKLVRDGNMDGIDCKKPYLDATLEKAVLQDIRYGLV